MSCERHGLEVGDSRGDEPVLQGRQGQEKNDKEEGACSVFVVMGELEHRINALFHKE